MSTLNQANKSTTLFTLPKTYRGPGYVSHEYLESKKEVPLLFQPLKIKSVELKNRLVVAPMCMYSSKDGFMDDFHLIHYSSYAQGGASMVVTEATAVNPEGRISFADAGLWKDEQIPGFKRVVDSIHSYNSLACIQLAHAGRKASSVPPFLENARASVPADHENGWIPVAPSPIRWTDLNTVPKEMTEDDILHAVNSFRDAAARALEAGFDMIEIHGAHGYLITSFLSPTSNLRTDSYGGSFENRCRFLFEIIAAIRTVWPTEKPLSVRLSAEEWVEDGWTIDDTVKICQRFQDMDVDIFDCSSGGNSLKQKINVYPGYQIPLAHKVKQQTTQLVIAAVGLINTGSEMESTLQQGRADLIFNARGFLRNPHFAYDLAEQLNVKIDYNVHYERGRFRNTAY
ncbi:NADH:flavin oxidoreductase/NADH oxidase domain-containing protein [Cavenderia fasciculata]|uniref:NADH:flavin oxidoreductase/NADH oxidase domain-containing protein n=1 Tax=Cavenderia fasciculata TaxID=261658 RepID=F4QCY3_CACFS|nr:NADH:flavin oxidoreductase/NADH oxidase domain-containing protein [Cavenderia fasciculata]EGG14507.1 NADH:flavin oxidoreductase/NADH oxidase domain-containing protein [Cavenderia fasciculata]|eukprot:XP_004353917.1 NADH:flavin oxidoreductase/NADH oxidase domain-containing protein [Cavenderia fasciculata]